MAQVGVMPRLIGVPGCASIVLMTDILGGMATYSMLRASYLMMWIWEHHIRWCSSLRISFIAIHIIPTHTSGNAAVISACVAGLNRVKMMSRLGLLVGFLDMSQVLHI